MSSECRDCGEDIRQGSYQYNTQEWVEVETHGQKRKMPVKRLVCEPCYRLFEKGVDDVEYPDDVDVSDEGVLLRLVDTQGTTRGEKYVEQFPFTDDETFDITAPGAIHAIADEANQVLVRFGVPLYAKDGDTITVKVEWQGGWLPQNKPKASDVTFPIRKMPHVLPVPKEIVDDSRTLTQRIQQQMSEGVAKLLDKKILEGEERKHGEVWYEDGELYVMVNDKKTKVEL